MKYCTCILFLLSTSVFAQFNFSGDAVSLGDDCYRLTTTITSQEGAIWSEDEININYSFRVDFELYLGNSDAGADGMTFALQQDNTGVGIGGGDLAIAGISPSIVAQFDTWQNLDHSDPTYDHVSIMKNGGVNHSAITALSGYVQIISGVSNAEDNTYHDYTILWDAETQTFGVYVDCVFRVSYTGDIVEEIFDGDSLVYFGFTAATGGAVNSQIVCFEEFSYTSDEASIADVNICEGESVMLEAPIGYASYIWSPDIGISDYTIYNPIFNPDDTTTYTVTYDDGCGTTLHDTVNVFVYEDNSYFTYGTTTYCPVGIIEPLLIESPGGIFTIEPATLLINTTTGEIDIEGAAAGNYFIEYAPPADECSDSHSEIITIDEYPDATIAYADTLFCAAGSIWPTLITTLGGSFSISPMGVSIDSESGEINLATAIIGNTYTVTYTTDSFCPSTATFSFIIQPFDDASFAFDAASFCPSGTTIPVSIETIGGTFSVTPATIALEELSGEIDLSTATVGTTYFITYTTSADACSASTTVSIYIDPLDDASFGYSSSSFCASGTIDPTFITTGGGTFSATPATLTINSLSGQINLETGTVGTSYTITYTTPDGPCQNSMSEIVTINANDDSTFSYLSDIFCPYGTALPDFIATPDGPFSVSPAGVPINIITGLLELSIALPGEYIITYTTPSGLCSSTGNFNVTIDSITDAFFAFDTYGFCNYGIATPFILNTGGIFSASSGLVINNITGEINLDASSPGGPYAVFYNSPGCSEQDTFLLTVYSSPTLTIDVETPVCIESDAFLLHATPVGGIFSGTGVSGNYFYPTIAGTEGTYTITYDYTDANGCANSISNNIEIIEHNVNAGIDITIIESTSVQLNASDGVVFFWDPVDGLNCTGCQNPEAQPLQTTNYFVTSYDINGCVATDDIVVTVVPFDDITVFVPNAFTPNNDGLNDHLFIFGSDIEEIISLQVYDRWGAMIWRGNNIPANAENDGWDGTYAGKLASNGVYAYIAEVKLTFGVKKLVYGNVSLLR